MTISFIFDTENTEFVAITPHKIRFTSSINNQTSTLSLTFITPSQLLNSDFFLKNSSENLIILLVTKNLKFSTKELNLIWVRGKPILIKARFLITSEAESIHLKNLLYHNFDCLEHTNINKT